MTLLGLIALSYAAGLGRVRRTRVADWPSRALAASVRTASIAVAQDEAPIDRSGSLTSPSWPHGAERPIDGRLPARSGPRA